MLTKKTRRVLLVIAGALAVLAIVWSLVLHNTSHSSRICREINRFGYRLAPDDLHAVGSWEDTSVRALLPNDDLDAAIQASLRAGFPSDVDKRGAITLLMANPHGDYAITLFLIGSEIELAFVQVAGETELGALGE